MAGFLSKPPRRRLLIALFASLLLHLWVTGGIDFSVTPEPIAPPPIEARLTGPAIEPSKPAPKPRPVEHRASPARAAKSDELLSVPKAELILPAESAGVGAAPVATEASVAVAVAPEPPPAEALPKSFKIRFSVQGNEGGLVLGKLDHVWQRKGDRYSLVGVAEASGLFALFYSGLLSQTSMGSITSAGLQPKSYWLQRGRKSYSAQFDWDRQTARLGGPYGALPLASGAQDYVSVVYQLALFDHPVEGRVVVIDGKRAKEYIYREIGLETIELPMGKVETLRIRIGQGREENDMDLWLRAQPPHLPVKMTLIDDKGRTGVLLAEAIE